MNCTQVERMVPLYVEGDLTGEGEERAVSAHLRSCDRCRRLADEYRESQSWLRSHVPPEFGAAFYDGIRDAVMEEINRNAARPSFFQLLAQPFPRLLAFAAAAALLLISSMVAFDIYRDRAKESAAQDALIAIGAGEDYIATQTPQPPGPKQKTVPRRVSGATRALAPRRVVRAPLQRVARHAAAPVQAAPDEHQLPLTEVAKASGSSTDRETLRIELQTSDPNIRIIWFSPKGEGQLSTKPTINR